MKVTLDLSRLLEEGRITREEHDRLLALGAAHTGSLAFNILIAFGVIAVSAGLVALVPDPTTGIVLGLVLLGGGLAAYGAKLRQWDLLAHICVLIGALGLAGGLIALTLANPWAFAAIAVGFAVVGAISGSGLLVVLAVLALSSVFGARTDYMHATYFLGIEQPTLTILVFTALALATYLLSQRLPAAYERIALIAARTSLFLVNFGFWIGSLWGDAPSWLGFAMDDLSFSVAWAVALIATGVWAAQANRPWVVNIVAVFAAIHFYTQWFERLGPQPLAILVAGLIALGIAIGLWNYNRSIFGGGGTSAKAAA